ncbi:MAG: hypothetical protein NDJ90_14380 [Oligoflexia bacterium]|nr:hypothetical protein [Oligoflexia bacterium]
MKNTGMVGKSLALIASLGLGLALGAAPVRAADKAKALEVFKDRKCHDCHGMTAHGIGKPKKAEAAEDEEGTQKEAPDLSTLSPEVMKQADPVAFVSDYLKKKAELNGKKHKKIFKGSSAELKNLAEVMVEETKKKAK